MHKEECKFELENKISKEEEKKIRKWITTNGIDNKKFFQKKFPSMKYPYIKFKWNHVWNPNLKKGNWTDLEDLNLFVSFVKNRGSWSIIAVDLKNRSRISIRNRFVNSFKSKTFKPSKGLFENLIFKKKANNFGILNFYNSNFI